ncbi:unnamed protein product [Adineta ricciae]|uniref:SET domain-containing protein n=2 Tax=Adineta ricciae TaxID=249248 RepID=A0A815S861_ADIRI|nr:unnamed protein product [Adineta ricciae]
MANVIDFSVYSGILVKKIYVADISEKYGPGHRGLFAAEEISAGEIIFENDPTTTAFYPFGDQRGIYSLEEFYRLISEQCDPDVKKYLTRYSLQYDDKHVIVPKNYLTRDIVDLCVFMNHSCEANCSQLDVKQVSALKDIEAGSMLTVDYGLYNTDDMQLLPFDVCRCGVTACAGNDVFKRYKHHDWQEKHYDYCSPYVRAKIDEIRKQRKKA